MRNFRRTDCTSEQLLITWSDQPTSWGQIRTIFSTTASNTPRISAVCACRQRKRREGSLANYLLRTQEIYSMFQDGAGSPASPALQKSLDVSAPLQDSEYTPNLTKEDLDKSLKSIYSKIATKFQTKAQIPKHRRLLLQGPALTVQKLSMMNSVQLIMTSPENLNPLL